MRENIRPLVYAALCTALLCILSPIAIPMPSGMPFTLQTFAVALAGYCLKPRHAALSVTAYLLLGLAGLPIFSAFRGGISAFAGPTGGFLLGFLPLVLFISGGKPLFAALGLLVCHTFGVLWFSVSGNIPLWSAFLLASAPYLLKDVVSVIGARFLADTLQRRIFAKK